MFGRGRACKHQGAAAEGFCKVDGNGIIANRDGQVGQLADWLRGYVQDPEDDFLFSTAACIRRGDGNGRHSGLMGGDRSG